MSPHRTCREIEPALVAVATGEAPAPAARAVEAHLERCGACRRELARYRAVEEVVTDLRRAPVPQADPTLARAELEARLAELRRRRLRVGVFDSPVGPILIARSELGVSCVEYLTEPRLAASRLACLAGADLVESPEATEALFRDLLEYLAGRRTRLEWPLDLSWARSGFHRRVLEATSRLPYGAVTSYGAIAGQVGAPTATRAVAQALRRNPVPIVVPCHRVVGAGGDLTGYAGPRVDLKQRLLALEGVRAVPRGAHLAVDRRRMYARPFGEDEYCLPTCGSLPRVPLKRLMLFGSRRQAEAAGLRPCSTCRPDLAPLPA